MKDFSRFAKAPHLRTDLELMLVVWSESSANEPLGVPNVDDKGETFL